MRRFGWIGAGVLLLAVVAVAAFAFTTGPKLLAGSDSDPTERAVEPTGAKKDPPKAAEEPEKEEPKQEETKQEETKQEEADKDEPDEELNNKEQAEVAESFSAPKEPKETAPASASASAAASARWRSRSAARRCGRRARPAATGRCSSSWRPPAQTETCPSGSG